MPLEGNLREFGLADVLQFISGNQKAGVLQLNSRSDKASIAFDSGKITGAVYGRLGKQDQLQNYLMRSKKVNPEQLESILAIQHDTSIPLGDLLIKEGLMNQEEIDGLVVFKIQEVLDEVFTWSDARYKFNPEERLYRNSRSRVAIPAESLILEALRRKDEWPAIARALPSDEIIVKKTGIVPLVDEAPPEVIQVHEMIDGARSIGRMIEEGYLGRFRTFSAVYQLVQGGAAEVIYAPEPEPNAASDSAPQRVGWVAALAGHLMMAVGLAIMAGGGLAACRIHAAASRHPGLAGRENLRARQAMLRNRIEAYYIACGRYPAGLEQVSPDSRLSILFQYQAGPESESYRLEPGNQKALP